MYLKKNSELDYYAILGLRNNASSEEVRKALRIIRPVVIRYTEAKKVNKKLAQDFYEGMLKAYTRINQSGYLLPLIPDKREAKRLEEERTKSIARNVKNSLENLYNSDSREYYTTLVGCNEALINLSLASTLADKDKKSSYDETHKEEPLDVISIERKIPDVVL